MNEGWTNGGMDKHETRMGPRRDNEYQHAGINVCLNWYETANLS